MSIIQVYFLDASALVKLVTEEPGSSSLHQIFPGSARSFYTSSLCIAEALGVLKRKWEKEKVISKNEYFESCYLLFAHIRDQSIHAKESGLDDIKVFFDTEDFAKKHELDLSDALQLYTLKNTSLKSFVGKSAPLLITADAALAKAAKSEGLQVWNCVKEPRPT